MYKQKSNIHVYCIQRGEEYDVNFGFFENRKMKRDQMISLKITGER
jgi:hypothetical protein